MKYLKVQCFLGAGKRTAAINTKFGRNKPTKLVIPFLLHKADSQMS